MPTATEQGRANAFSFFFFKKIIVLFGAVPDLRCCEGHSLGAVHKLLMAVASLVVERGL